MRRRRFEGMNKKEEKKKLMDARPDGSDEAFPNSILLNISTLTYELGSLAKCLIYGFRARDRGARDTARAYFADGRIELADLLTQCQIMCENMDWNFEELRKDGEERYLERMKEIRGRLEKGGVGE